MLNLNDLIRTNVESSNIDSIRAIEKVRDVITEALMRINSEYRFIHISPYNMKDIRVDKHGFHAYLGKAYIRANRFKMSGVYSTSIFITENTLSIDLKEFIDDDGLQAIESLNTLLEN